MSVCILVSTCDKYIPLAELTIALLDKRWAEHPPVFICGVSKKVASDMTVLPLQNDYKDWIGIIESAAHCLLEQGYQKCYLILDDHPPLATCNERILNDTLPSLMTSLGAVYIGLYGWDQGTVSLGEIMSKKNLRLQRQSDLFTWRFSLHPALWDIKTLEELAKVLPPIQGDIASRSAWAFERRSGDTKNMEITSRWNRRSYRIFGAGMLKGVFGLMRGILKHQYHILLNFLLFAVKETFGASAQEKLVARTLAGRLYYDGPYPLYWSGVMQKGRVNGEFERFMTSQDRLDELDKVRHAIQSSEIETD